MYSLHHFTILVTPFHHKNIIWVLLDTLFNRTYVAYKHKNNNKSDGNPSSNLNVEMTEVQEVILNLSINYIKIGRLLNNAGGKGAWMNITETRLTYTVEVESFGALTNSDERLWRLDNAQVLTASLSDISRMEQSNKESNNGEK